MESDKGFENPFGAFDDIDSEQAAEEIKLLEAKEKTKENKEAKSPRSKPKLSRSFHKDPNY